jgi:predicted dehydrogenase
MTDQKEKTVRLGIIGVGGMGSLHARTLLDGKVPGVELTEVCDHDPERLEKFKELKHWSDADAMIAEGGVEAVLIATPHYDHVTYGVKALQAGLHVLVEKPIAVHKADAERLIAAHTNPDQVFSAMFNQRTDPCYQWVREKIQDGTLGRINRVNWIITDWFRTESYYRNGGWRATWAGEGGGVLLNQCPHQLDLWQWLFGMPAKVHAFTQIGRFHDIEVEDDVTAHLQYEDGMRGVFITTTGEAPGTNRLEIAAENGRVVIEGSEVKFDRNAVPTSEHSAICPAGFTQPKIQRRETISFTDKGEQHVGIMKNFINAILGKEALLAPAPEGIHSVELGNAMLYSGLTEQAVEMPLDAAAYETKLKELIASSTFVKQEAVKYVPTAEEMKKSF